MKSRWCWAAWLCCCGCWPCAAIPRKMPPGPPRAWARAYTTGWGAWAPGWPTAATSCLVFPCGGCWWPSPTPGWRRWCAGCAAATAPPLPCAAAPTRTRPSHLRPPCAASGSGWGWRCCWRPARRWSGRACTVLKACCPGTPGAWWAICWGLRPCSGWASPARACWASFAW